MGGLTLGQKLQCAVIASCNGSLRKATVVDDNLTPGGRSLFFGIIDGPNDG